MKTYATGDIQRKVSSCCYAAIRDSKCRKCGKECETLLEIWVDPGDVAYIPEIKYQEIMAELSVAMAVSDLAKTLENKTMSGLSFIMPEPGSKRN